MFTVTIHGGTPAFNDGEPCVFSAYADCDNNIPYDKQSATLKQLDRDIGRKVQELLNKLPDVFLESELDCKEFTFRSDMKAVSEVEEGEYDPN